MSVKRIVSNNVEVALKGLFAEAIATSFPHVPQPDPLVVPGKFSDFQCNNAMGLTKALSTAKPPTKMAPKEIGNVLISNLPPNDLISGAAVTEQGFITVNIASSWLAEAMKRYLASGVTPPPVPKQTMLVDFSSPNIAKEMHVGHLRSTIIGECICRLLEFVGHDVNRINHVGDWGTQFGMLILYMKINFPDFLQVPPPIADLAQFYKAAKAKFDADPDFKDKARLEVVKLQALEPESINAWKLICDLSRKEFQEIYDRLNVKLEERGESFYNPLIPSVLQVLRDGNQIEVSDGAEIVVSKDPKPIAKLDAKDLARVLQYFVSSKRDGSIEYNPVLLAGLEAEKVLVTKEDGTKTFTFGKEVRPLDKFDTQKDMDKLAKAALPLFKSPLSADIAAQLDNLKLLRGDAVLVPRFGFPLIARKSDGGYTYDTTDLAAAYHRFVDQKLKRVIYITDMGQFEHFNMVLQCAGDMGWLGTDGRWDHAGFGLVSGEDGKKLKTRSGETTKLKDLLDEAVTRARENLEAREADEKTKQGLSPEEINDIAKKIGYGAVKYFDLKQNRTTDYQFSYDKMLDFAGNTAVFQLYSYARICSIKRKANVSDEVITSSDIAIAHEKERLLALAVLKFEPTILKTVDDLYPHHITDFCYDLVNAFSDFYQACKVVGDEAQNSRLALIEVVGNTLKKALELLSIEVAQRL